MSSSSNPWRALRPLAVWLSASSLALLLFTLLVEGPHYLSRLPLAAPLSPLETVTLFGRIVEKSAWLLLPGLLVAGILLWVGKPRAARACWLLPTASVLSWLLLDLLNQRRFGNHLHDWLALTRDFGRSRSPLRLLAFAGDLTLPFVLALVTLGGAATVLSLGASRFERRSAGGRTAILLSAAGFLSLIALPALAGRSSTDRALRRELPWTPQRAHAPARTDEPAAALEGSLAALWAALRPRFERLSDDAGPTLRASLEPLPDVLLLAVESLRADSLAPDLARRFDARWPALELAAHDSGANASHFALFEILYGRSSLAYGAVLDRGLRPALPGLLSRLGYESVLASSVDNRGYLRMDEFLGGRSFARTVDPSAHAKALPRRDREILRAIEQLLAPGDRPPRFVLAYLMSTHYPFVYPREYVALDPGAGPNLWIRDWQRQYDAGLLRRRHALSCRFLFDEILRLLDTLDPRRTLVVLTGDHGESFGEDGALLHPTRPSRAQSRTLTRLAGAGIAPRRIERQTVHADLLATIAGALEVVDPLLSRGSSRDVRRAAEGAQEPYFLLSPGGSRRIDAVLVDGERRLWLQLGFDPGELLVLGEVDAQAAALPPERSAGAVARWLSAFERAVVSASH